jgi:hypothetical protein
MGSPSCESFFTASVTGATGAYSNRTAPEKIDGGDADEPHPVVAEASSRPFG